MPTPDEPFFTFEELLQPAKVKIYKSAPHGMLSEPPSEVESLKATIRDLHDELDRVHLLLSKSLDISTAHAEMTKYLKHNKISYKLPKSQNCVSEFIKALSLASVQPLDDVLAE